MASAVQALRAKWGHENTHKFEQYHKNKCGAYLQYKKQPKDKAIPKDLIGQRERSVEWITCPSPTTPPNQSDDEGIDVVKILDMVCGLEGGVDKDDSKNE